MHQHNVTPAKKPCLFAPDAVVLEEVPQTTMISNQQGMHSSE